MSTNGRPAQWRRVAASATLAALACGSVAQTSFAAPDADQDGTAAGPGSAVVAGVDDFPTAPSPWAELDWHQRAIDYDAYVYDWTDRGVFTTIREDTHALNMPEGSTTFSMPAYYGDTRTVSGIGHQEAVTLLASVVGATLVGVDKSDQDGHDYVDMLRTFFHPDLGVAKNTPASDDAAPGGKSMWYATTANVLYSMLAAQYPDATDMTKMQRSIADQYYEMLVALGGPQANLTMQDFDFATMTKITGRNEGGDAAAGTAAILLWAHDAFGDQKYLDGAKWAMDYLEREKNLYYEMLPLLAPYVAARLNAEAGTDYDVTKYLATLRAGTDVRGGWGTIEGTWGGYDVSGLSGSRTDLNGYAFAMNSFATPWLAATARYDTRYADAVGRWMLQVYNASRFFYADQMPVDAQQHGDRFVDDPAHVIAYEGVRHQGPAGIIATADTYDRAGSWGINPETTQLGVYGSSWVGFLGATLSTTNVERVLRTDLDALDLYAPSPYPTSLYYNPREDDAVIDVHLESADARDLYDAVSGRVLAEDVSGAAQVTVPAGSSLVLVEAPTNAEADLDGATTTLDGVPVRYDTDPQRDVALTGTASGPEGTEPGAALDGDESTAWRTDAANEQTLDVDLGTLRPVSEVKLAWTTVPTGNVTVETSTDGNSWAPAASAEGVSASGTFSVTPRDARYVRVHIAAGEAGEQALSTLEVRARDLARSAPAEASTTANAINVVDHLTDDSRWTRWESTASDPQYVQVDLGSSQPLGSIVLRWEAAAGKAFEIQASDDAQAWQTVARETDGKGGTQVIPLDTGAEGRYLKVVGTQRLTQWAYSLHSLEVYAPAGRVAPEEPDLVVAEAQVRCLAGRAYLAVRAQGIADEPLTVELATPYGTTTRDVPVAGNAYQSFASRATAISDGVAQVSARTSTGNSQMTDVPYTGTSCS
ncbi:discoidin domain-containing protein [Cellulosimicrobium sp. SH8]|uniref:discoidin domain-containing protein n=1 Tax=Cellulosimicrobium sp. SH8 TaxID=2952936 RepID=UPI0021F323C7|nr:discoidin domain-containing protein [Cellulosimicrobium sp. SH8]